VKLAKIEASANAAMRTWSFERAKAVSFRANEVCVVVGGNHEWAEI
jgi:hypothetical protein